jgi:hypothetical protein
MYRPDRKKVNEKAYQIRNISGIRYGCGGGHPLHLTPAIRFYIRVNSRFRGNDGFQQRRQHLESYCLTLS